MNNQRLYETFLELIKENTQASSKPSSVFEDQIIKKHKAAFMQNRNILIDPKTLIRIEAIKTPDIFDPIKEPEISFINKDDVSTFIEKDPDDYSACVLIDQEKIIIWIDSAMASDGLVIGGSKEIEDIPPGLKSQYINMPINPSVNFIHNAALIASKHRIFVYLPEKFQLPLPILFDINANQSGDYFPIHLVNLVASDAQGMESISMHSSGREQTQCLIELIVHNVIGRGARFDVVELQEFSKKNCDFIALEQTIVLSGAEFRKFSFDSGSESMIRNLSADLTEAGSSASITGVYSTSENQSFLFDTAQNHLASNTTSDLLFKGVLKGKANTLWKGNIFIEKGTHSANGYQMNNNLLLETSAKAESIPGLEILADDVRCSHGVTLSNINSDQLFYLKSRGIDEDSATALIVGGFFESTFSRVHSEFLLQEIRKKI
jgi:Fe-S cluster assembly protein SufD